MSADTIFHKFLELHSILSVKKKKDFYHKFSFLTDSLKPQKMFLSRLPIGFFPCHKGYIVNLQDPLLLKNI